MNFYLGLLLVCSFEMCAGVPTTEMKISSIVVGTPQHKAFLHTNNGFLQ
jgi:hypothetical protein